MINVNLLPPELKEEIKLAKKNRVSLANWWKSLGILILIAIMFSGCAYFLWQLGRSYDPDLVAAEAAVAKYKNLEVKAEKEQQKLTKIKAILAGSNKWSNVLEELNRILGSTITMTNLRLDSAKNNRQSLSGEAPNRDAVIALRDSLEDSKLFRYVDIDSTTTKVANSGSAESESFVISFSLEDGALK